MKVPFVVVVVVGEHIYYCYGCLNLNFGRVALTRY